jgi:hypothetical protein
MDLEAPLIVKTNIKKSKTEAVNSPTIYSPASVVENVNTLLKSSPPLKVYWKKNKKISK